MPQEGSVGMMLGIGQYALLSSYAQTREIPVSVQKAIGHLLVHSTKTFTFTPAVKDAGRRTLLPHLRGREARREKASKGGSRKAGGAVMP